MEIKTKYALALLRTLAEKGELCNYCDACSPERHVTVPDEAICENSKCSKCHAKECPCNGCRDNNFHNFACGGL